MKPSFHTVVIDIDVKPGIEGRQCQIGAPETTELATNILSPSHDTGTELGDSARRGTEGPLPGVTPVAITKAV
jgi:hypothetical protein